MPRLFVAIEFPNEVQQKLASVQDEVGKVAKRIRWVSAENIHLTLQFLGSCPEELIPKIEGKLEEVAKKTRSFTLHLGALGGFPSLKRARVLWVGTEGGKQQLVNLQEMIEEHLLLLGFTPEERKFHPHATLARLKVKQDVTELVSLVDSDRFRNLWVSVDKVTLFESKLKPSGATYIPLVQAEMLKVDTNTCSC